MADKRMFAKTIVDSDTFLEMPISARLLYYDLGMRADDDGFVDSPKKIMRMIGATNDDMNILITRKFIIPFDSGIVVIRHWRINNYLRSDRYTESIHLDEKSILAMDDNKSYLTQNEAISRGIPLGIPVVGTEKKRIEEKRKDNNSSNEKKKHQIEVENLFDSLWKIYVRKEGKSQVNQKSKEEIFNIGFDRMEKCITKYAQSKKGCDKKYLLMGSTFFNGRYKDYLEEGKVTEEPETVEEEKEMTDEEWVEYVKEHGLV